MIKLAGVSKSFGSHAVLRDITVSVGRGEIVAVTGNSGCGKTTLLNIVSKIVKPDHGTVELRASGLGYSFQKDILFPWMSAEGNILFVLKRYLKDSDARLTAERVLDRVGLLQFRDHKPASMSGGMQKRLGIARAFAVGTELLILDEPFASLDRMNAEIITGMITEAAGNGTAVVFATHETGPLKNTGARILSIGGGQDLIMA